MLQSILLSSSMGQQLVANMQVATALDSSAAFYIHCSVLRSNRGPSLAHGVSIAIVDIVDYRWRKFRNLKTTSFLSGHSSSGADGCKQWARVLACLNDRNDITKRTNSHDVKIATHWPKNVARYLQQVIWLKWSIYWIYWLIEKIASISCQVDLPVGCFDVFSWSRCPAVRKRHFIIEITDLGGNQPFQPASQKPLLPAVYLQKSPRKCQQCKCS